jgi:hypothetical protein
MIIDRCADGPSSDCRETAPGSGAELQHATLRAIIEAATRQAGPTLGHERTSERDECSNLHRHIATAANYGVLDCRVAQFLLAVGGN